MIWVRLPVYRLYLLILFRRISTWYSPQRDSTSHAYLLAYARSQSMYVTNKIRFRLFLWLRVYWVFQMVIRWWVISDGSYWGESQDCLVLSRIKLRSSYLWRQGDVHFVELHYQKKKKRHSYSEISLLYSSQQREGHHGGLSSKETLAIKLAFYILSFRCNWFLRDSLLGQRQIYKHARGNMLHIN